MLVIDGTCMPQNSVVGKTIRKKYTIRFCQILTKLMMKTHEQPPHSLWLLHAGIAELIVIFV